MDIEREIADAQVGRVSFDSDADDHLAQIARGDWMVGGTDGWDSPDSSGDRGNPKDHCADSGGDSETLFDYRRVRANVADSLANLGASRYHSAYQIKAEAVDDFQQIAQSAGRQGAAFSGANHADANQDFAERGATRRFEKPSVEKKHGDVQGKREEPVAKPGEAIAARRASRRRSRRLSWSGGGSRVGQSTLLQQVLAGRNHTAAALAILRVRGDLAVAMRTFHDAKALTVSAPRIRLYERE